MLDFKVLCYSHYLCVRPGWRYKNWGGCGKISLQFRGTERISLRFRGERKNIIFSYFSIGILEIGEKVDKNLGEKVYIWTTMQICRPLKHK